MHVFDSLLSSINPSDKSPFSFVLASKCNLQASSTGGVSNPGRESFGGMSGKGFISSKSSFNLDAWLAYDLSEKTPDLITYPFSQSPRRLGCGIPSPT